MIFERSLSTFELQITIKIEAEISWC